MRIVVNDIAASKGGALTVLKDFYNCVRENDTDNEWIFLLGEKLLENTSNIKTIQKNVCKCSLNRINTLYNMLYNYKVIFWEK